MAKTLTARRDDRALRLDNQLCFAVYSTAHALNRVYKPLLRALGLTYPQYLVMLALWEADDLTVNDIGARLQLDSGTLTPLLKRLATAGLVQRTRDPADERQVRIALTAEGRKLRERAAAVPAGVGSAIGRPAADIQALKADLIALRDRLNQAS